LVCAKNYAKNTNIFKKMVLDFQKTTNRKLAFNKKSDTEAYILYIWLFLTLTSGIW
jgi:hypothetical protein